MTAWLRLQPNQARQFLVRPLPNQAVPQCQLMDANSFFALID